MFQPVGCAYQAWQEAHTRKKQGRVGGPPWPQPAHQVTNVNVVQKKSPLSTMGMLPACLHGHMAMLVQKQDLVLVLNACVLNHRKSPKKDFSQCAWDRKDRALSPHMLVESSWVRVSRFRVVLLFVICVPCWHQQVRMGDRGISGFLTSWQSTQPEPHLNISQ